ncbi:MAG TPA: CBS domain-containing protein, partial [Clostridiales bacterium]|nr:CBS domain-containing protein [Clostridiales bacterium]
LFVGNGVSRLWGGKGEEQGITTDELVTIIETVEDEGVIDEERSDLLQSAIEFSEVEVREIITHRVDMLAIDIDDSMDDIIKTVMESSYSRLPVYEDNIDNIIGVLVVNQFYRKLLDTKDFDLRSLLTPVCYVHESLTLPVVFEELQRQKMQLAVVIDEYGGTQGIVTMEDILEQLVGEIWDESDEVYDDFVELGENLYECSGDLSVDDFFDHLDMEPPSLEDDDYLSMGGWAIEMLDGFPNEGDHFQYRNLFVTVTKMKEQRVVKLQIEVDPLLEAEEQEEHHLRNQH